MRRIFQLLFLAMLVCAHPVQAEIPRDKTLVLLNWPNHTPPALLERFTAETGIAVELRIADSNTAMLSRIGKPDHGVDLMVPSDWAVAEMILKGQAFEMRLTDMARGENIRPPHDSPPFDAGRVYSAPYLWGSVGFSYRADLVPGGSLPESWSVFFAPDEAGEHGRLALAWLDDEVELYTAAAFFLDLPLCGTAMEGIGQIQDLLQQRLKEAAAVSSRGTIERILSGTVAAQMQWNTSARKARARNTDVVYVYPEEGTRIWQDNFVIPAGAPNPDAARAFVNFMLAPENAAEASNFTGYMNTVAGSETFLATHLRDDPAVNTPDLYADRLRAFEWCGPELRELRFMVWQNVRSRLPQTEQ